MRTLLSWCVLFLELSSCFLFTRVALNCVPEQFDKESIFRLLLFYARIPTLW